ncbi:HEAT repeat domain-containing protein [Blastococcus deserti]|uniref:HEAT repeat domain-containing protein n=1 Tax=Blastococcus deserti TaxID=2259033 RepID=A0ABW4X4J9_9ACTN
MNTFMAELAADPDYQARIAAQDMEHECIVQRNRVDAAPLASALAELGFTVEFPEDLLAQGVEYRAAIPLLIRWLPRIDNPDVKCSVIRALTVPWAGPEAARALVEELRRTLVSPGERSAMVVFDIANALEVVADESVADDLLELSRDRRVDADARAFLVQALGGVPQERVVDALLDVVRQEEDPLVLTGALNALGRLRDRRARDIVETCTHHGDRRVRKEALRVLKRLR